LNGHAVIGEQELVRHGPPFTLRPPSGGPYSVPTRERA
jgi:hypothetical protein